MKYKILIEGGFAAIPKRYEGEVILTSQEMDVLFTAMEAVLPAPNEALRDAFSYHIRLEHGNRIYDKRFNEPDLPNAIRNFVTQLKQGA
ncbi:protealysin inhibitor emfourin [Spongiimicrobium sp. 2-473A-2-J]|uniref:protealysin inhibitor emfourin n=1 Tax=Eudoraea algarum TaxID=3417568 RepID=UPI003D35FFF0